MEVNLTSHFPKKKKEITYGNHFLEEILEGSELVGCYSFLLHREQNGVIIANSPLKF